MNTAESETGITGLKKTEADLAMCKAIFTWYMVLNTIPEENLEKSGSERALVYSFHLAQLLHMS